MKRVIKIVLIFFVIFAVNMANILVKNNVEAESNSVQFIFRTDKAKYNVGDTVTVICSVKNAAASGFSGFDGTIVYDSSFLKYVSSKVLLNSTDWTLKYNDSTKIALLGYNADGDGLTKDGDIFQMQFTALKEGNFKVGITNVSIDATSDVSYTSTAASSVIVPKENTNTNTSNETNTNTETNNNTSTNTSNGANTSNNQISNTNANTNGNNTSDINVTGKDNTVANKIIPQTGVSTKVLTAILIVAVIGAVAGAFYDRYRRIK